MNTFEELDLIAPVQRALVDLKYVTPTPIQAQTIPAALEGKDILGCAQTGTGKTAAFALPMLSNIGKKSKKATPHCPLILVLAPTRELAIQIGDSFTTYGKHLRLRHALVYGGVSQVNQVRTLKRGAHILVATPGRLLDLMNQGHIKLNQLKSFILDEADQMLDMGFLPDLKRIIKELPEKRQSLFFSATLSPTITELSKQLLRDPVSVNVTPKTRSVKKIEQRVLFITRSGKQKLLKSMLNEDNVERALVFTKTKRMANSLSEQLVKFGFKATAIHGNKSQGARQRALEAFRRKQVKILVATDVAARGIDIDGITHVFNYDLPVEPEAYVHRIGRTGRAGAEGVALSFCCGGERRELRAIEKLIGQKVPVDPDFAEPEPETSSPSKRRRGSRPSGQRRSGSGENRSRRSSSGRPNQGGWKGRKGGKPGGASSKKTEDKDLTIRRPTQEKSEDEKNNSQSQKRRPRRKPWHGKKKPSRSGSGASANRKSTPKT